MMTIEEAIGILLDDAGIEHNGQTLLDRVKRLIARDRTSARLAAEQIQRCEAAEARYERLLDQSIDGIALARAAHRYVRTYETTSDGDERRMLAGSTLWSAAKEYNPDAPQPAASLLERLAALLSAARAYRDAWAGCSFAMGPLAIGVRWERLKAAIDALDEKEKEGEQ
jgi:hypothetical protein